MVNMSRNIANSIWKQSFGIEDLSGSAQNWKLTLGKTSKVKAYFSEAIFSTFVELIVKFVILSWGGPENGYFQSRWSWKV